MRRASVVLVLEKSVTMTSDQHYWDHDSDPNTARVPLWLSVHAAVHEVLSDLEDRVDLGAELFPSAEATNMYDATACAYDPEISVPVAALHHDEILAAMPPANAKLRGAYPVTAALEIAYDHLHSRESDEPKLAIAVLRSLPACRADAPDSTSLFESYDGSAEPTVVTARYTGIRTHFIALDASDENTGSVNDAQPDDVVPTEVFAALASAGGTPVNNARDQAQLAAALREILESLPEPSCVLQLDRALQSDDGAVVRVDGVDVPARRRLRRRTGLAVHHRRSAVHGDRAVRGDVHQPPPLRRRRARRLRERPSVTQQQLQSGRVHRIDRPRTRERQPATLRPTTSPTTSISTKMLMKM